MSRVERFEYEIKEGDGRMKVKITKSSNNVVWYKDMIGNIFRVIEYNDSTYRCIFTCDYFIAKEDCDIIESKEKTIPVELTEDEINDIYGHYRDDIYNSIAKKCVDSLLKLNEP